MKVNIMINAELDGKKYIDENISAAFSSIINQLEELNMDDGLILGSGIEYGIEGPSGEATISIHIHEDDIKKIIGEDFDDFIDDEFDESSGLNDDESGGECSLSILKYQSGIRGVIDDKKDE